jgi:hypothetical protein
VRSLYRPGLLLTAAREISKYKIIFSGSTGGQMGQRRVLTGEYAFYNEDVHENHELGTVLFCA